MSISFIAVQVRDAPDSFSEVRVLSQENDEAKASLGLPSKSSAIRATLPESAAKELADARVTGQLSYLLVEERSPEKWQDVPWETMMIEGHPLCDSTLVVRRAKAEFLEAGKESIGKNKRAVWINLFPKEEHNFSKDFEPLVEIERLQRGTDHLIENGLDGFDELFILAHGDSRGLLDQNNEPFYGLENIVLPPRVWLLACNQEFSIYRLAERLLARGVKTVITANGDISAPAMAGLVIDWLTRSAETPADPAQFLLERSLRAAANGASLTVFGSVTLDNSTCSPWNRITWDAWRTIKQNDKRLAHNGQTEFGQILGEIKSSLELLWPQTVQWLVPGALVLAETYDHEAMQWLEQLEVSRAPAACAYDARAKARYRVGDYQGMAHQIAKGLRLASPHGAIWTSLMESLICLLIDMDLLNAALASVDQHTHSKEMDDTVTPPWSTRRLDWRSRIAFKAGEFYLAIQHMESKQNFEKTTVRKGIREMAWLLYMRAWKVRNTGEPDSKVKVLAINVARILHAFMKERDTEGSGDNELSGNDDEKYLLRALCCYYWVSGDKDVLESIQSWDEAIREGLCTLDPGPWAFAAAYLGMAGVMPEDMIKLSISALKVEGYLSEAAAFAELSEEHEQGKNLTSMSLKRRTQVLEVLGSTCEKEGVELGEIPTVLSLIPQ